MKKVGFNWLREELNIRGYRLMKESYIGTSNRTELSQGRLIRTFKPKYDVSSDDPMSHLEFGLKYDDLNLAFMKELFSSIDKQLVIDHIKRKPNRKYARIVGFFYEFTTGETIDDPQITTTNYVDVLDAERYVTGEIKKVSKWKVNDNLLGSQAFCPLIRKTTELREILEWDVVGAIDKLQANYSLDIFRRASYYLYTKETKSSNEIENEQPSKERIDRFISLLEEAGQESYETSLSESELVRIQNAIVDPRYADSGFRDFQNYIGQTMRDYTQKIHYICPPPEFVRSLMQGLIQLGEKSTGTNVIIKAAMVSFGYVYIHPFTDGNGRIHRFLIHDILVRDGVVPQSTILPVSAQILAQMDAYDSTLEQISDLIHAKAEYGLTDDGELIVHNAEVIEAFYRFPDLTDHAVFLAKAIKSTVMVDIPEELLFLQRYDQLKAEIQGIVDMPTQKVDRMITFLHQNKGKLAVRKRKMYQELQEEEIQQMEAAYQQVFRATEAD